MDIDMATFSFGKNWQDFVKRYLTPERIKEAEKSLKDFTGLLTFKDKTFLDIGCGSGLFSYAAWRLGAKKIISFDIDVGSVRCCKLMREKAENPKNWQILRGSILNKKFLKKLEKANIVYAWGVLHHTGKMWQAIENSAKLVKLNGLFYLAIYNKNVNSKYWRKIKKRYHYASRMQQILMETAYISRFFLKEIISLRNPVNYVNSYHSHRGMNWLTDVRDWLGGYPYEFATPEEIILFCQKLGLTLENIKLNSGRGNNEFLFRKEK